MASRPKPRSARAGAAAAPRPARSPSKAARAEAKKASPPAKEALRKGAAEAAPDPKRKAAATGPARAKVEKPQTAPAKQKAASTRATKAAAEAPRPANTVETEATALTPRKGGKAATDVKAKLGRPKVAAASKSAKTKKTPTKTTRPAKSKTPPYLAVELGTPVDPQGEPIGAGSPRAQSDRQLQEYALQLWRQMQRGSVTKRYMRSMERAGITLDEVWTVGLREVWTTSSTADEMRRYRQRMLFRANLLEAIMSETIADLHRLEGIEPRDGAPTETARSSEPSAPQS